LFSSFQFAKNADNSASRRAHQWQYTEDEIPKKKRKKRVKEDIDLQFPEFVYEDLLVRLKEASESVDIDGMPLNSQRIVELVLSDELQRRRDAEGGGYSLSTTVMASDHYKPSGDDRVDATRVDESASVASSDSSDDEEGVDSLLEADPSFNTLGVHACYGGTAGCAICISSFKKNDLVRLLWCEHLFHQSCIDSWLRKHTDCPLCKLELFPEEQNDKLSDVLNDMSLVGTATSPNNVVDGVDSNNNVNAAVVDANNNVNAAVVDANNNVNAAVVDANNNVNAAVVDANNNVNAAVVDANNNVNAAVVAEPPATIDLEAQ